MNVELKEAGEARKVATVTFEAEEVAEKEKAVLKDFTKLARIPGFRAGKAPANVVRKQFAKQMGEELTRKVSEEAYEAVLEQDGLRIHSVLGVDAGDVSADAPAKVEVTVDVEPEFEIPDYASYELQVHGTEATDEDVEREFQGILDQRAAYETVEREVKEGDYVKCSYEGTLDGTAVAELVPDKPMYGKQANTWEEAGSDKGLGVPAVAEGIVGMKAEEKKTVEESFDEDFELPPLAGKTVSYELEVHEVREKRLPDVEDKGFLESLKVENVDELRDRIKENVVAHKERENENGKRRQVTQKLIESDDFPLPPKAVEDEAQSIFQRIVQSGLQQGAEREEVESKREELWQQAQTQAAARVKMQLILSRIAEKEEIQVDNEELARAATQEAMMRREDPQTYVTALSKNRAEIARLQRDVLHDKTLELIVSKAHTELAEIDGENAD